MFVLLIIILLMVLLLPFYVKKIENNLEIFLFVMGLLSTIVSNALNIELVNGIFKNHLLYMITFAVLIAGFIFKIVKSHIRSLVNYIIKKMSVRIFLFLVIVILGLASSIITAIITALILVEIVVALPLTRDEKINLTIIACFSIGLGAVLTPIGEPLATIVTSKLNENFWYLFNMLDVYIVMGICALGIFGGYYTGSRLEKTKNEETDLAYICEEYDETNKDVIIRSGKIFLFIIALELLGAGFKPLIDTYVIKLNGQLLFWINMISAILDNATLAAAEISNKMSQIQIKAILMGLLISGGMLIPGNIPNIISAHKLKISSKEWAKLGVPLGLSIMAIYFVLIFYI